MMLPRGLYSDSPPERRTRIANNPTLLTSWWCTIFSLVIIFLRIAGRYVRNERLFREDKIMAWSVVPLLARMGFVHVVLIYGTNNVQTAGLVDPIEIHHREIGSRLVLAARICYASYIWMAKFTVSEFLKRLTERFWKKRYNLALQGLRIFLGLTFVAVVVATLAECHPFSHNWEVLPDPGPKCRQGYAHLITMGVTDIITDILLVCFPIPIILRSGMHLTRKLALIALFSMSIVLVAITGARVPLVIARGGLQQFRTVFASSEVLAATVVANAIVLGSFLRDRGVKKTKYKVGSTSDSMDRRPSARKETLKHWGSDEDLARSVGIRTTTEVEVESVKVPRPAPVADLDLLSHRQPPRFNTWQFPKQPSGLPQSADEPDPRARLSMEPQPSPRSVGGRRVSFFDVGGLLEEGSLSSSSPTDSVVTHNFATQPRRGSRASSSFPPQARAYLPPARRSSRLSQQSEDYETNIRPTQALQDPSGLLSETREHSAEHRSMPPVTAAPPPQSCLLRAPTSTSHDSFPSLQNAGDLISPSPKTS